MSSVPCDSNVSPTATSSKYLVIAFPPEGRWLRSGWLMVPGHRDRSFRRILITAFRSILIADSAAS